MSELQWFDIEDACLNASAPPQQLWLDGWLLRFCPGKAKRARSINAVALGRLPLAEKLERAAAVFRDAQLPLVVRITPFSQPSDLDAALATLGYARFDPTHVMVAAIDTQAPVRELPPGCTLARADALQYAEVVGALRGTPPSLRASHAQRLRLSPVPYQGWFIRRDEQVLVCGQFAREGQFVGLYDVYTAPFARGQGWAKLLCSRLLGLAAAQGARTAYLQVAADNAPAIAVYHALGFAVGYDYHYRALDPAGAL